MLTEIQSGTQSFELALDALSRRRIPEALELLNRAECLGADPAECAAVRWRCWMLLGQFEDAWRESDRIESLRAPDPHRFWDGRPFTGKRVVIRCLHGFGDAIQFVRYVPLISREASQVLVQTHPELISLMRGIQGVHEVFSWSCEGRFPWDQQIEVMELPRAFRTNLATIPRDVPYISVLSEHRQLNRIPASNNRPFRVGLQWGAGAWDSQRSIPLRLLERVCSIPGPEFYSFQREPHCRELPGVEFAHRLCDVSGTSKNIAEAAADLLQLDLLITVDTMLAHLAGALGKPVWVLLQWNADWRWMLDRRDSPWYPTMRLFRQRSPGDWESAVTELVAELEETAIPTR